MTQLSRPWDGVSVGDATNAPYDAPNEWAKVWRSIAGAAAIPTNLSGVFAGELNALAVTGVATPVSIATGRALTHGIWYESDAVETIAIPTPSGATRIDRIVLRKSWAAQTIRLTRIAGAEGGAAPALVQIDGTTWDQPLAQVSITTGGTITVTDERQFLSGAANLSPSRVVATDSNRQLVSSITSANLRLSITDPTGTGAAVFADAPTFTTLTVSSGGAAINGTSNQTVISNAVAAGLLLDGAAAPRLVIRGTSQADILFADTGGTTNARVWQVISGDTDDGFRLRLLNDLLSIVRTPLLIASAGNVTIAAPASGVGLTVAGGGYDVIGNSFIRAGSGLVIGHTAQLTTAKFQILGTDSNTTAVLARFSADTGSSEVGFYKSRNNALGSNTIVAQNDRLGAITAYGANGTGYNNAAQIAFFVDNVPGAITDMPGRIEFYTTPDGSGTLTLRVVINNQGNFRIAAPTSGEGLNVLGGGILVDNSGITFGSGTQSRVIRSSNTLHVEGTAGLLLIVAGLTWINVGATTTISSIVSIDNEGLVMGAPTGGNKGLGTINVATDVFKNNSAYANPDYVFEHYFTNQIVKYKANPGADSYGGLMPLNDLREYVRENWRFPGITDEAMGMFDRGDHALRLIEMNTLYLFDHEDRITRLEEKVLV